MGIILTKTPLPANGSYTQDKQDRFQGKPIGIVGGLVYADKAGTLYLEESDNDGQSWSTTTTVSVIANITTRLTWVELTKRWYRFRYVNDATAQGSFILIQQVVNLDVAKVDAQLTGSTIPNVMSDGYDFIKYSRFGSLAANTAEILIDTTKACVLEMLEFSANEDTSVYLQLYGKNNVGDTQYYQIIANDGSTLYGVCGMVIRIHKSSLFQLDVDATGTYKITIKPGIKLTFPSGCKIAVLNDHVTNAYNCACIVGIKYLEA